MYRVDHFCFFYGSGLSYVETIDVIDSYDNSTAMCYEDYCENIGDWISIVNNETNEEVAVWKKL